MPITTGTSPDPEHITWVATTDNRTPVYRHRLVMTSTPSSSDPLPTNTPPVPPEPIPVPDVDQMDRVFLQDLGNVEEDLKIVIPFSTFEENETLTFSSWRPNDTFTIAAHRLEPVEDLDDEYEQEEVDEYLDANEGEYPDYHPFYAYIKEINEWVRFNDGLYLFRKISGFGAFLKKHSL